MRTAAGRRAWVGFIEALVHRYGPGGGFWQAHPDLPGSPIRSWQIWNEPNFFYFASDPDPDRYARLVEISHRALAAADPGAKLILGGMFALPGERPPQAYPAYRFLAMMFERHPEPDLDRRRRRDPPLHPRLQVPVTDYRSGSEHPEEGRRPAGRALDHRARLGLSGRGGRQPAGARAPRPGTAASGGVPRPSRQPGEVAPPSGLLVHRDRLPRRGGLQFLRLGRPVHPPLPAQARLVRVRADRLQAAALSPQRGNIAFMPARSCEALSTPSGTGTAR